MNADVREMAARIRAALPPVGESTPETDLWPRLERRLDDRRRRVDRLDWLLVTLTLGLLASFPEALLLVLYHF